MTHYDKMILRMLCDEVEGLVTPSALAKLQSMKLFSTFRTERLFVRSYVAQAVAEGRSRAEAFRDLTGVLNCSLSKIKNLFY